MLYVLTGERIYEYYCNDGTWGANFWWTNEKDMVIATSLVINGVTYKEFCTARLGSFEEWFNTGSSWSPGSLLIADRLQCATSWVQNGEHVRIYGVGRWADVITEYCFDGVAWVASNNHFDA